MSFNPNDPLEPGMTETRRTYAAVCDQPGEYFALILYPPDSDPVPVSLTPGRALALAESLLAAARRRIDETQHGVR